MDTIATMRHVTSVHSQVPLHPCVGWRSRALLHPCFTWRWCIGGVRGWGRGIRRGLIPHYLAPLGHRKRESSAIWIESTPSNRISLRSNLISIFHLPSCLFHSGLPVKIYRLLHLCYMPRTSNSPLFGNPNNIRWREQIMELLIMQFSANSCHFVSHRSKYCLQHPVLKHPQHLRETNFHTRTNQQTKLKFFLYFNLRKSKDSELYGSRECNFGLFVPKYLNSATFSKFLASFI
jgi:hypothetical protein